MSKIHIVQPGESLSGIASIYGFTNWRKIYDHPQNADFKTRRLDPNIIYPNDRIFIPDITVKEYSKPTDQEHVFTMKLPKALLRLILIENGQPLSNKSYELEYDDQVIRGRTGFDGKIEVKVPVRTKEVVIKIGDYRLELAVGHLNPLTRQTSDEGISGIQSRLYNLGYGPEVIDGRLNEQTRTAIKSFQFDRDLRENGEPDAETRRCLEEEYGC